MPLACDDKLQEVEEFRPPSGGLCLCGVEIGTPPKRLTSTIPLRFRPHSERAPPLAALRAPHAFHYAGKLCLPARETGQRFRARRANVPALALERQHVLTAIIGELDDGEWRARRHHAAAIVASMPAARPSSSASRGLLYVLGGPTKKSQILGRKCQVLINRHV